MIRGPSPLIITGIYARSIMTKESHKNLRVIFWSALRKVTYLIVGAAIMFFFQEPLKRYLYESKPKLEYIILSSQELTKSELLKVIRTNFKQTELDFSIDDNIISKYHYTVIELRNPGPFIEDDLLFDIDFKDNRIKILDVLCKMIEPEERELEAEIERPPLELKLHEEGKDTIDVELSTSIDNIQVGIILYRSYSKHGGFGRRNPVPSANGFFSEKVKRGRSYFYTVSHLGYFGRESKFTSILPFPECSFNSLSFKNTKRISLSDLSDSKEVNPFLSKLMQVKSELKQNENICEYESKRFQQKSSFRRD